MSFDYLQAPKLCYRLSSAETAPAQRKELSQQLATLFRKYKTTNKFYDTVSLHSHQQVLSEAPQAIESFEPALAEMLEGEDLDIDKIRSVVPLYFVALEFSKLNQLLRKLLLMDSSNMVEMLCYSYICNIHRLWYSSIAVVNVDEEESSESVLETLENSYKRIIVNVKTNTNELTDRVRLFNYLNNMKMMRLGSLDISLDRIKEMGFLEEYLASYLLQFVLTTPFNKLHVGDELFELVEDSELYKYTQSLREGNVRVPFPIDSLNEVKYILPTWGTQAFHTYIKLVMSFKLFLSTMSYTSKITSKRLFELIGDEFGTNYYIMLIGSLDLQKVGIGYEDGIFYNNGIEADSLQENIDQLNRELSREAYSLILGSGLVNKFVD